MESINEMNLFRDNNGPVDWYTTHTSTFHHVRAPFPDHGPTNTVVFHFISIVRLTLSWTALIQTKKAQAIVIMNTKRKWPISVSPNITISRHIQLQKRLKTLSRIGTEEDRQDFKEDFKRFGIR